MWPEVGQASAKLARFRPKVAKSGPEFDAPNRPLSSFQRRQMSATPRAPCQVSAGASQAVERACLRMQSMSSGDSNCRGQDAQVHTLESCWILSKRGPTCSESAETLWLTAMLNPGLHHMSDRGGCAQVTLAGRRPSITQACHGHAPTRDSQLCPDVDGPKQLTPSHAQIICALVMLSTSLAPRCPVPSHVKLPNAENGGTGRPGSTFGQLCSQTCSAP